MTSEEAIKILEDERGYMINHAGTPQIEAFTMAIKALKQEPCDDCVSRKLLDRELYERFHEEGNTITTITLGAVRNFIKELPSAKPVTQWHKLEVRPLTDEEKEVYGEEHDFIYDCKMPSDGQEVLVKTQYGIEKTTYYTDYGCYFEDYEDKDDVIAWTELPKWEDEE